MFSLHGARTANGPDSSMMLYFNEVCHVGAPVGRQTITDGVFLFVFMFVLCIFDLTFNF